MIYDNLLDKIKYYKRLVNLLSRIILRTTSRSNFVHFTIIIFFIFLIQIYITSYILNTYYKD